jgi:hypothetical protein
LKLRELSIRKLHGGCSSLNIREIKLRRMKWTALVGGIGEKNAYKNLVEKT